MALCAAWPGAQQVPPEVEKVLAERYGFSRSEVATIARGTPVARALEVHDDREVSAVGAVHIAVPPRFYVERLLDIVRFKRHEAVLQIGVFGETPSPADVEGLTLDRDDLQRLRTCAPSNCDVNLSADAIGRVRAGVTWGTAEGHARATRQFKVELANLVRDYRREGDAALMTYAHEGRALSVADEFRALVTSPPPLLDAYPTLRDYVMQYPRRAAGTDIRNVIYWSKEKVGPRTVTSITHMVLARLPATASPAAYVAASRQIYGSQLYEASLGLTAILQDPARDGQMYLVYANRSRVDAIGGFFGVIKRGVVRSRARAAVPGTLERAKVNAERRFAEQNASR